MKRDAHLTRFNSWNNVGLVLLGTIIGSIWAGNVGTAVNAESGESPDHAVEELRKELEHIKSLLPGQAHAMHDVSYRFENLWFAVQHENWALADFYLAETRSHLKWAVRIIPVRSRTAGDVDLGGILESIDTTLFAAVKEAIDRRDVAQFRDSYRESIEGCYACHKAVEKPYLRLHVPERATVEILNFDPEASGPQ